MCKKVEFIKASQVPALINDGCAIGVGGFVGTGVAEEIHLEVAKHFLNEGKPKDLTLIYSAGIGDGKDRGLNHYAHENLVKRIIGGHWGLAPKFQPLVAANKVEAYNLPQGVISQLIRDSAAGKPRTITHVGMGTFVDPDIEGGKLNEVTKEDIVEKVTFDGKTYLAYKTQKMDVAIIKGTEADEKGNIGFSKEPLTLEAQAMAMNAKNSGGIVIVQVEKKVKNGTINPKDVKIPHILVDYVVVVENIENHMQTFGTQYNETFVRNDIAVDIDKNVYPLNERKVIARRAAMLLDSSKNILNYGIGVPEVIAQVLREEGQDHLFTPTVEPGAIGGTPAGGLDFGASISPEAIIDQPSMFDFYDGGGIDMTFLGLAQCDKEGNINVSKFGPKIAGCGGFINITQNSREIVFCGAFSAGGLKVKASNGKLEIIQEGKNKKFIDAVEQITFSGNVSKENNKKVIYITERAVFELRKEGLVLTEIAPGVDLQNDILKQMDFEPIIPKDMKLMDEKIFLDEPMGLVFA
ncbi:acyl CoA:acetate/3-ketoacid CoA transferase [Terrisporobacter hibernicus]|uniref:Acyl CoA:acetate/3-ketoacid CoA transferase n=1 Tax=Terrisporobacter hibernicus TaxID=2813371 RepID=A0AAX2ZDJ9_9FIRM|nr:acyl CoA:acetate/3-ketoacid CoA transferase [Terrisporobacter hibernicus]UEL46410.1 acyl CoA:acetate/3-ketoacid CoA transferase [Terrisporobacter hibernicus]